MAAGEIHVGDVGVDFQFTVKDQNGDIVDVSGFTNNIIFKKPDNTILNVPASFITNGIDGGIHYKTLNGDLNLAGMWRVQISITNATVTYDSDINTFKVYRNLV